jgi:2-methylcitrate dehydratase PrpD
LTIEHGFFDAFLGLPGVGHEVVDGLGEHYLMRQIAYKRYPVGGPDQTPLHAFLHLLKSHELAAEDIEQIEVSVSRGAFHTVMTNRHPSVHLETILALAAVYGEITFQHIHDPSYRDDSRVKAFQDRARLFILPRPGPASMGQRLDMGLTVRTRSGAVLRQELRYPLMTAAELEQKFRELVGLRLESRRVADLERQLKAIESVGNVAPLIRELELDS